MKRSLVVTTIILVAGLIVMIWLVVVQFNKSYLHLSEAEIRSVVFEGMKFSDLVEKLGQPDESFSDGMNIYQNMPYRLRTNTHPAEIAVFVSEGRVSLLLMDAD
jgi:ABC-type polysaccharide/polyol phosphate transport system ATPase subunit